RRFKSCPRNQNPQIKQTLSFLVKHWGIMRARLHQRHINTAPEKPDSPAAACTGVHCPAFAGIQPGKNALHPPDWLLPYSIRGAEER
ncbi:hypothetical protein, partial [Pontitalea aquivivens]|uniref:hypothetical protein n=1 Tax=Pontitalea aquivivens TaxID=3388663 RepID=UPI0039708D03